jgi:hypothetical protein
MSFAAPGGLAGMKVHTRTEIGFECTRVVAAPGVTHLKYCVGK